MINENDIAPASFWKFLNEHEIEIPIIQRDYAQGRDGKEDLRARFLDSMKKALVEGKRQLKLDFLYGSEKNGKFQPLDGQQRLTTLWLLHWYIAYRAGSLNELVGDNPEVRVKDVLKRFTYETRISSREFCERLASFDKELPIDVGIVNHIKNQSWFFSAWEQDPTIQAMLQTLGGVSTNDGIEGVFDFERAEEYKKCWRKLKLTTDAPIVFYYMPLKDFGLSDDLYVKMNARGKPLTSFENFKADLIGYIRKRKEEESEKGNKGNEKEWKDLLDPKNGIPIKLDNTWIDIFWENKSSDENKIDEIYYAFLNRFFWNELFIAKKSGKKEYILHFTEGNKIKGSNDSYEHLENEAEYSSIEHYKIFEKKHGQGTEITLDLFKSLEKVFDNYLKYKKKCDEYKKNNYNPLSGFPSTSEISFPDMFFPKWIRGDFEFIPKYKKTGISDLNKAQRVIFFALCKYLKDEDVQDGVNNVQDDANIRAFDKKILALKRWMRVVCNLVSGKDTYGHDQIESNSDARRSIEYISGLDSHNVYNSLKEFDSKEEPHNGFKQTAFGQRWYEEIEKAKKISDKDGNFIMYDGEYTWERIIIEAEEYAFFEGAIRFLYQNDKGAPTWDQSSAKQGGFTKKWENVQRYFEEEDPTYYSCLNVTATGADKNNPKLLKKLIGLFDEDQFRAVIWPKSKKSSFVVFNNRANTWRHYLLSPCICGPVHELLCSDINLSSRDTNTDEGNSPSGDFEGNMVSHLLYWLSKKDLLDYILKENIKSEIGEYYGRYAMHWWGKGVFLNEPERDKFFKNNAKITFYEDIIIEGDENRDLLCGADIYFAYDNRPFVWCLDGFIYLQNESNHYISEEKDPNARGKEKYYCFNTRPLNRAQIMEKLDELKRAYEDDMRKKAQADPPSNS